ncbi:MAG: MoaD/ThiS family protein [Dehalococcoidia bacterium]|nr:MoaD/ThiS family protein [Dehalococcoidia bacterium]
MATVHIPAHWRTHTDGRSTVEVAGRSLGAVIQALGDAYPGLRGVLFDDGALRGEVAVAIDSVITENDPLEPVGERAEIFLVPAIAGG